MKNSTTLTSKETEIFASFCKGMDAPFTGWLHEMADETKSTSGLVSSLVKKGLITSSDECDDEPGMPTCYWIDVTPKGIELFLSTSKNETKTKTEQMTINTKGLSMAELVSIYNAFAQSPVKKFSTLKVGQTRIKFLAENECKELTPEEIENYKAGVRQDLRDRIEGGIPPKKEKAKKAPKKAAKKEKAPKKAAKKEKAEGGVTRKRGKLTGKRLLPLVPFNPFNGSGRRAKNFDTILVSPGITTEEYLEEEGIMADLQIMIKTGYVAPLDKEEYAKAIGGTPSLKSLRKKFYVEMGQRTPLETIEKRIKKHTDEYK